MLEEFWMKMEVSPENSDQLYYTLFSKGAAGTDGYNADYEVISHNGKISVYRLVNDNYEGITGQTKLTTRQWHHVAVVRSGTGTGDMKLYINGKRDNVSLNQQANTLMEGWTKTNAVYDSTRSLFIGKQEFIAGYPNKTYFQGFMHGLRVSDTARYTNLYMLYR